MDTNEVRLSGIVEKATTRNVGKKNTLLLELDLKQEVPSWNGELTTQIIRCQCLGRQAEEIGRQISEGQAVRVVAKLDGREWNDKIFINCSIQSVEAVTVNEQMQDQMSNDYATPPDMEIPF
jgi:single-stranded DNA-binding protein